MKFNKVCSAALAAVLALGTAMPAMAETQSTTVTLGVAAKNQYTMIIPSNTELNHDGSAKALTNGLTIKCEHQTKDVVVTLEATNEWKLVSDEATTQIGYGVYASESSSDTTKLTKVTFTKAEIMKFNDDGALIGTTKDLYVKPDAADLDAAEGGNYYGTISFTAKLKADAPAPVTINRLDGMDPETIYAAEGQTWTEIAANNENMRIDDRNLIWIDDACLLRNGGSMYVNPTDTFSASENYVIG